MSSTINIDSIPKDSNGVMNFTTMSIPSGVTVNLTGNTPARPVGAGRMLEGAGTAGAEPVTLSVDRSTSWLV